MLGAGCVDSFAAALFESCDQVLYRTGLAKGIVVPASEHLQESPLGPFVIGRITSTHLTVPVIGKTDAVHLLTVAVDVLDSRDLRMLAGLDGVLLGRKAEGVVSHGMQHIETLEPLVPGENITGYVPQWMAYMKSRT